MSCRHDPSQFACTGVSKRGPFHSASLSRRIARDRARVWLWALLLVILFPPSIWAASLRLVLEPRNAVCEGETVVGWVEGGRGEVSWSYDRNRLRVVQKSADEWEFEALALGRAWVKVTTPTETAEASILIRPARPGAPGTSRSRETREQASQAAAAADRRPAAERPKAAGASQSAGGSGSLQPSEAEPPNARESAFRHFSRALEIMEDYEKAQADEELLLNGLEEAEAAVLEDGSQGSYWHLLGYVYTHLEEDTLANVLAEDALTRAFELNPRNVSTRLMLARLLLNRDSYDRALYHLESVLFEAPDLLQPPLAADMCRAYLEDEQVERGEKFFRRLIGEDAGRSSSRLALAILLHSAGQTGEALLQLETLLELPKALPEDVEHARLLDRAWKEGDRS